MSLKQKLSEDIKEALKRGEKIRCSAIRLVMATIQNAEIDRGAPLDDSDILGIITKSVRQHKESIEAFSKGNRPDLVAIEEEEMAILMEYLPMQMTREEITVAAREVIEQTGAKGPGDKGKVMPQLISRLKGQAWA